MKLGCGPVHEHRPPTLTPAQGGGGVLVNASVFIVFLVTLFTKHTKASEVMLYEERKGKVRDTDTKFSKETVIFRYIQNGTGQHLYA